MTLHVEAPRRERDARNRTQAAIVAEAAGLFRRAPCISGDRRLGLDR